MVLVRTINQSGGGVYMKYETTTEYEFCDMQGD